MGFVNVTRGYPKTLVVTWVQYNSVNTGYSVVDHHIYLHVLNSTNSVVTYIQDG